MRSPRNQYQVRKAERHSPPVGRFIDVDGVRLHYLEKGIGPAIVLLHGNSVTLQDGLCSGLFDRLAERHRVIAFDRPGFGYSERPRDRLWTSLAQARLFHQAFNALNLQSPVVLGHSWGTLVALDLAVEFPANVRGLILVSGYYYPSARLDAAISAPAAIPLLGDAMRYTVSPVNARLLLKRTAEAMFAPIPLPQNIFAAMPRDMLSRPQQIRAEAEDAAFMIPAAARLHKRYPALRMPVAIFGGADDKIVDVEVHSVRLHEDVQHSTLSVLPGAGHMVHYAVFEEIELVVRDMARAGKTTESFA
ncbi:alpha/beta fold hydrolase [Caballeronia novacaledonica]|uniref:alpha/beta fold hydrolase n=1 Tax=Caballeronia novacaledonica TaxID=1544861 RepID=UPI0023592FA3|nr:alpha/beta hydrolase [Caballeronia novacaledonica]